MEEQVKEAKEELKKAYLNDSTFKDGKKLFCCDILTGKVKRVKPKKDYFRHKKTGVITKKLYVMTSPNLYYLTADSLVSARDNFEKQFNEMAKEIEEKVES